MERKRFTPEERRVIWEGRKAGLTLLEIARGLDRRVVSIFQVVRKAGGVAPRPHSRPERALRAVEREEISRGLASGISLREIARRLDRAASTVSREVARNGGRSRYRAAEAEGAALKRACRPQVCLLARRPALRKWVAGKLELDWSPRQIAVGLKQDFPDDPLMQVSHETIYRSLFVQARNVFRAELIKHLRRGGYMRRPKSPVPKQPTSVDGLSIHERPADVEDRAVPGHWEGDLLMGGNSSQIVTLVERRSRYVILIKVDSKDTITVTKALAKHIRRLPKELKRSVTWDRGSEMAAHKEFTIATDVQVYLCDPRSPWQRGSNENTNGLLRQYFPKGEDLSGVTQARLNQVAKRLNERPRETLNWRTPLGVLKTTVASTG